MWKEGKRLLSSHGDVLYCDSMWNVSRNGYYALTIVILDENYTIRLAAMSITKKERKVSWSFFVEWVKYVVPSFKPSVVVTDGASYIDKSFTSAIGSSATHIVCWWHRRQNAVNKAGVKKKLAQKFLSITLAHSKTELYKLQDEAYDIARKEKSPIRCFNELLNNCVETALISLTVFTGGTVTNSYSECINNLLRRAGLTVRHPMLTVLRYLHNFCVQQNHKCVGPFTITPKLRGIIGIDVLNTVTAGALLKVKSISQKASRLCEIVNSSMDEATIDERIRFRLRRRRRTFEKHVLWHVDWKNDAPVCSCNGLVYSGIPCKHIIAFALKINRLIPLTCYNPRFYIKNYDDFVASEGDRVDQQPQQEQGQVDDGDDDIDDDDIIDIDDEDDDYDDYDDDLKRDDLSISSLPVSSYSSAPLVITDPDEIMFYQRLQSYSDSLVNVRRLPNFSSEVDETERLLSSMSNGILIGFGSFRRHKVSEIVIPNDIIPRVLNGDQGIISICDNMHIASADMDSKNPSDDMCRFRGRLRATVIKIILFHRLSPRGAKEFARNREDCL